MSSSTWKKLVRLATLAAAGAALVVAGPSYAEAPMAQRAARGFYRMMLGDFEVTALNDGTFAMPADKLLKQSAAATEQALAQSYLAVPVETSVNGYLINTGARLVLIDAGAGAFFGPTLGKLVANLKASGYQPAQVDEIYITHLHIDHLGGLVADGERVFRNATVRVDQRDADYWLSQQNLDAAPAEMKDFFKGAMAALKPYIEANKFQPFESEAARLANGIAALPTPGHTPGHTTYEVSSGARKLWLIGDLIHVAGVQLDDPSVTIAFDVDPSAAAAMRKRVFTRAANEGTPIGASHIAFPGLGRLRAAGEGYHWLPLNFTQMNPQ